MCVISGIAVAKGGTRRNPVRLFVSHIHEEALVAVAIKSELLECFGNQVEIFLAEDIPLGTNWLNEIQSALAQARVVLVLFSRLSSTRPWINIEAGYGVMAGKQVLPLCHSGFGRSDLPVIYGLLQSIDVSRSEDVGRLLDQVAKNTPAGKLLGTDQNVYIGGLPEFPKPVG
jgi:hypothetical protein